MLYRKIFHSKLMGFDGVCVCFRAVMMTTTTMMMVLVMITNETKECQDNRRNACRNSLIASNVSTMCFAFVVVVVDFRCCHWRLSSQKKINSIFACCFDNVNVCCVCVSVFEIERKSLLKMIWVFSKTSHIRYAYGDSRLLVFFSLLVKSNLFPSFYPSHSMK